MVGRDRHRSPVDRTRTLAAIEIDIHVSCDLARRHPASRAKFEQAPLDEEARDQIDVAEHPDRPPLDY